MHEKNEDTRNWGENLDLYESLTYNIEALLDEADLMARSDSTRYTHEEVFSSLRQQIYKKSRSPF